MNLPNKLTLGRVFLIPVYMVVMYLESDFAPIIAGVIFIIASLTDTLDGYLARKNNLVTDFGKFADPLADKVLVLSSVAMFVECGVLPAWSMVIIIFRELTVTGFRCIAASKNRVLAADVYGKLKTVTQLISLSALHFVSLMSFIRLPAIILYYVSVVLTALSGANYLIKNRDIFQQVKS